MAPINTTIDKFGRRNGGNSSRLMRGPPGVGFKLAKDGSYDMQGKRLKNLGEPKEEQDGVTRIYVDEHISECIENTQKAVVESADIIIANMQKYVDIKDDEKNKECRDHLANGMHKLNEDLRKHFQAEKTIIEREYQAVLDKRIGEATELLRRYVNAQMDQLKYLADLIKNTITMEQSNTVTERVAKIEKDVKVLFQRL